MNAPEPISLRSSSEAFEQRLERNLGLIDQRALIVIVIADSQLCTAADGAINAAARKHGIDENEIVRYFVSRDGAGRERLQTYNRARDRLLASKRLIYLRAGSAADVRFLREVAPDLTAVTDIFVELEQTSATEATWPECSQALRKLMRDRHGTLDFTGLLPANVEQRILPLSELYQSLIVFLRSARHDPETTGPTAWIVLGHPGSGKTTYVRHLAWTYAGDVHDDPLRVGNKVPLLVSLSDFGTARATDRVLSLVDFLPQWLAEQGVPSAITLASHLPEILLLLDGLDELPSADLRAEVLRELNSLLADRRVGAVVVTGRSFLVDELAQRSQYLRLATTRSPKPKQMQAFVRAFVRLRRGEDKHASDLIARIERDADLHALASTPLMLAFMVILDELEGRLPDRRIEIYYRLGEMLVDRWTRARSIGASASQRIKPTRADAMRVLGPLAWWTVEHGGGLVSEQALRAEIERIEARRETAQEAKRRAAALLDLLRSDTALLVPQFGGWWRFVHQSIGEYFAGVEVERAPQRWQALLDDPFRPEWREILLFCAGQLGVIEGRTESLDQLVAAILKKARRRGRYDAKYPSLLMGLLTESPGLSGRQIELLVARLLELVFEMAYSREASLHWQFGFVALLADAREATAEHLGHGLREWFRSNRIRWDRVFSISGDMGLPGYEWYDMTAEDVAQSILGPFGSSLVEPWVKRFDIDLGPALQGWSLQPSLIFRFAKWWIEAAPLERQLPWMEVRDRLRRSSARSSEKSP